MWLYDPPLHFVAFRGRVPVQLSDAMCCNCGTTEGVSRVPMTLRWTLYLLVGGVERSVEVQLPSCAACAPTVGRASPGLIKRLFVTSLWAFLGWIVVMAVITAGSSVPPFGLGIDDVFWISLAVAFAACAVWYFTRRPRGAQTSYYQPVRLAHRSQDGAIVLACTHCGFANDLAASHFGRMVIPEP